MSGRDRRREHQAPRPESVRPRGRTPKPSGWFGGIGLGLMILGISTGGGGGLAFLLGGIALVVFYLWIVSRWQQRRGVEGWKLWRK